MKDFKKITGCVEHEVHQMLYLHILQYDVPDERNRMYASWYKELKEKGYSDTEIIIKVNKWAKEGKPDDVPAKEKKEAPKPAKITITEQLKPIETQAKETPELEKEEIKIPMNEEVKIIEQVNPEAVYSINSFGKYRDTYLIAGTTRTFSVSIRGNTPEDVLNALINFDHYAKGNGIEDNPFLNESSPAPSRSESEQPAKPQVEKHQSDFDWSTQEWPSLEEMKGIATFSEKGKQKKNPDVFVRPVRYVKRARTKEGKDFFMIGRELEKGQYGWDIKESFQGYDNGEPGKEYQDAFTLIPYGEEIKALPLGTLIEYSEPVYLELKKVKGKLYIKGFDGANPADWREVPKN